MMDSGTQFVVTAWRTSDELLQLRHSLYNAETNVRERAVNKVFAWRLRKSDGLPLLLDSTADLVDVILQDEKGELKHNALRLLYAAAISRFVTGVSDTQIDLTRDRPSWFPPGKSLQLPLGLFETRHRIVHRHLPSLAELKRAAKEALDWLWEWYWSQLDYAFSVPQDEEAPEEPEAVREKLNLILKTYVKERKNEIKAKRKESRAADSALTTFNIRFSPTTSSATQRIRGESLLQLLVDEEMILPSDKKLGASMSGAFLIWMPFILAFCIALPDILPTSVLLTHLLQVMNVPSISRATSNKETDPAREGLHDWLVYLLTSDECRTTRDEAEGKAVQDVLTHCFSAPSFWNLKLAASLLEGPDVRYREHWLAVLEAARMEKQGEVGGEMDVDSIEQASSVTDIQGKGVEDAPLKEKTRGPQRVLGMWRPRPIGWMPEGWDDDK